MRPHSEADHVRDPNVLVIHSMKVTPPATLCGAIHQLPHCHIVTVCVYVCAGSFRDSRCFIFIVGDHCFLSHCPQLTRHMLTLMVMVSLTVFMLWSTQGRVRECSHDYDLVFIPFSALVDGEDVSIDNEADCYGQAVPITSGSKVR